MSREKKLKNLYGDINNLQDEWASDYFYSQIKRVNQDLDNPYLRGKNKILEVGAAPYHFSALAVQEIDYREYWTVDIEPNRFKEFQEKYGIHTLGCDIEREPLPFSSNYFDRIVFNEVFEHLRIDPIFTLKEIHRVLKSTGMLLMTTPNLHWIENFIYFNLGMDINSPYKEFNKIYEIGHMGHIREYSKGGLKEFLENLGFKVVVMDYYNVGTDKNSIVMKSFLLITKFIPKLRSKINIIAIKR